jgi:hypothetical protein
VEWSDVKCSVNHHISLQASHTRTHTHTHKHIHIHTYIHTASHAGEGVVWVTDASMKFPDAKGQCVV